MDNYKERNVDIEGSQRSMNSSSPKPTSMYSPFESLDSWRVIMVCVYTGFVWALGSNPMFAQEAQVHSVSADWLATFGLEDQRFDVAESDHFSLATDVDHGDAGLWLGQLESTYASVERFSTSLQLPFVTPSSKLHIIVFANADELQQFADRTNIAIQQSNGLYVVESNVSVFVDAASHPLLLRVSDQIIALQAELGQLNKTIATPEIHLQRDELRRKISYFQKQRDRLTFKFNLVLLRHEAAHQIFYNTGIHNSKNFDPLWLREGLACLFEIESNEKGDMPVNRSRLYDLPWLREMQLSNSSGNITARDAISRNAAQSCRDFTRVLISEDEFLATNHADAAQRYALAWSLVYYLSQSFPQAFAKYVQHADTTESLDRNTPMLRLRAFEALFGNLDEEFCTHWLKYLASKRLDHSPASR